MVLISTNLLIHSILVCTGAGPGIVHGLTQRLTQHRLAIIGIPELLIITGTCSLFGGILQLAGLVGPQFQLPRQKLLGLAPIFQTVIVVPQIYYPQGMVYHKGYIWLQADNKLYRYNSSTDDFTQYQNSNFWDNERIYGMYQDDTFLYVQTQNSTSQIKWWRSNNLAVTWVQDFTGSGHSRSYNGMAYSTDVGGRRLRAFGWDLDHSVNYNNGNGGYHLNYRQFNQVTVTFASNSQLSNINVGDFMRS